MQPKRGELVPLAEALAGMHGPVRAIREPEPPATRTNSVSDTLFSPMARTTLPGTEAYN